MHLARQIGLRAGVRESCRNVKKTKYANRFAVCGGNQIAADQNGKQNPIERDVRTRRANPRQFAVAFQGRWWRRKVAPDESNDQSHHQQDANAFVQFRSLMVPAVVIAQRHHPQT
ncbi:hypothetical protein D3C71_1774100 [compost metagenome]